MSTGSLPVPLSKEPRRVGVSAAAYQRPLDPRTGRGSAVVGRNREAGSGTSGVRARPRGDQPSGAVTRMSGALGEISPSAMTSTEANLSVLVMSTGVVNE